MTMLESNHGKAHLVMRRGSTFRQAPLEKQVLGQTNIQRWDGNPRLMPVSTNKPYLFESRIERYFAWRDGDHSARFLLLVFKWVDVAIVVLLTGVVLRELGGMGLGAFSLYPHYLDPHLDPPTPISRINHQQSHFWLAYIRLAFSRTGEESCWQSISSNLHFRQGILAKPRF
jgi:hypothetical protein